MPNQPQLDPTKGIVTGTAPAAATQTSILRPPLKTLAALTVVLLLCFAKPLYELVRFALKSELFSHVLLIPFISGYLVWTKKDSLPIGGPAGRKPAFVLWAVGLVVLLGSWLAAHVGFFTRQDYLSGSTFSFVILFVGACFYSLGPETLRAIAFPLGFLIFMVPFPTLVVNGIETFLQHTSAIGADWFLSLSGMSFASTGLLFQLPGIQLEVAPECSGIHSSLVLFITSILAGQLFLASPWKRTLLAVCVIPLGIIRNAFRIWVIGELCVHVSPAMINSPIHRRGGPLFFLLSLVPLCLLLIYLRKSEQKRAETPPQRAPE